MADEDPDADYTIWKALLAGEHPQVHVDQPGAGFYVSRYKGVREPLAIWRGPDSEFKAMRGVKGATVYVDAGEVWAIAHRSPLTEEAYRAVYNTGRWQDDPGTGGLHRQEGGGEEPGPGHNNPPDDNTPEGMLAAVQELAEAAKTIDGVTDQASSDVAANIGTRLKGIATRAEAARVEANRPWQEKVKANSAIWNPIIDAAKLVSERLNAAVTKWQRDERDRRAAEAREAIRKGADPVEATPQPVRSGGASGRVVVLRTTKVAEFTDYTLFVGSVIDREDVKAFMQRLANSFAEAGVEFPGIKIVGKDKAVG